MWPFRPIVAALRHALRHVPVVEARAALLSLAVAAVLLSLKFLAYFLTGSAAIFSDALESIVNVVAAGFATYSLAYAHRPADRDHPYGHGKIEFMSAGFEGGMILLASAAIVVEALRSLMRRQGPEDENIPVALLLLGTVMVVHLALGAYLIRLGKHRGSLTLEADGRHLMADVVTSGMALLTLLLVRWTHWHWLDGAGAIAVAVYITIMGIGLVRRSAAGLLDMQDEADDLLLRRILDAHSSRPSDLPEGRASTVIGGTPTPGAIPATPREPVVCSYHALRHRHSGRIHWVEFHLVVPATWDVARGHEVASALEKEIEEALGGEADATAHVEPCRSEKCPRCRPAGATQTARAQPIAP